MVTELEKILGDDNKEVTPPLEEKKETISPEESPEVKAKTDHLANINKAIEIETEKLKTIRINQRKAKQGIEIEEEEEELPKIDLKDPSSKAWNKRIEDASAPARQELDRAKDERRLFTLRQFLTDKPALAKNPEKLKAMMSTYDRLKTSTELTSEGIMMDLEKAYAAEHSDELINLARGNRGEEARNDAIFSDAGVTRGSTGYSSSEKPKQRVYSEEEKAILAKWGTTPAEQAIMEEEMRKKS